MDSVDILTLTVIAFTGSFGHCLGMCGGIVIAYSSAKIDNRWKKSYEIFVHTLYSLGRVTTYVLLGTLFGTIGGVVKFNGYTTGVLTLIAGIFMILAGLSLIGKLPFLNRIEYSLSQSSWYQTAFRYILKDKSLYSFYLLGILNGLLPCGLVYFFAIEAANTGEPLYGALVMFIFGVSTIPAMVGLGLFTSLFAKSSMRKSMITMASIIVVIYGIYTIYRGYDFIRNPDKSLLNCCESSFKID